MVEVLTSPPISMVKGWVSHCSSVQHCTEVLDLHVYLLTALRQQGPELVDDHPEGQGIVCRHVINLLALPLDLAKFFMEHPKLIPESFLACWALLVELGVVSPRGGIILSFILKCS
jgi:hypothetical protein